MRSLVKLIDTVSIVPSSVDYFTQQFKDNKDSYLSALPNKSLRVDIIATHSGKITRNWGFYLPKNMRDGASTFLQNYGKPVLVHHDAHRDAIGRVVDAKYIDTSNSLISNSKTDGLLKALNSGSQSFFKQLQIIDHLQDEGLLTPEFAGLGYILLTADISEPEAIQKILDKRYLSVSIEASTDKAVCSICQNDWAEGNLCEHRPGKSYDEKTMFLVAGKLLYDGVSCVNHPADTDAKVVTIYNGTLQNSVALESDFCDQTFQANFALVDMVGGTMDKVDEMKVEETVKTEEVKDEKQEEVKIEEVKVEDEKKTEESATTENEVIMDESDKHYEAMIELGYEFGLMDTGFEDAKLTPEQRKGMSKSTFCKPNERKYPVPDCSHARSAMAYAKKYNESNAVIACINRKAKALGCSSDMIELDEILADHLKRNPVVLDSKTEEPAKAKDSCAECEKALTDAQARIKELEDKDESEEKEEDATKDELTALRTELKDLYAEFKDLQDQHTVVVATAKENLVKVAAKLDAIQNKSLDNLNKIVDNMNSMTYDELMKRVNELNDGLDVQKITDKMNDGLTQKTVEPVVDPTLTVAGTTDPATKIDEFSEYRVAYKRVLDSKGEEKATEFWTRLMQGGLVPANMKPETEGGNS